MNRFNGLYGFQVRHAKYEGEQQDGGGGGSAATTLIDDKGIFTETFTKTLPEMLGDDFYNDPETKQQPTKVFENIKDLKTFAKNYVNSQRKISQGEKAFEDRMKKALEGMVKMPGEKATAEEITGWRKAIGVPEKPEGYQLDIPEGDEKAAFESIASMVKTAAHKMGLPAKAIAGIWKEIMPVIQKQNQEAIATLKKQEEEASKKELDEINGYIETLKKEKGEKYDEFVKAGDAVLAKAKNGKAVAEVLNSYALTNHPAIRKFLAEEIAPLVLEGATVAGTPSASAGEQQEGFTSYKYDENGRPV